MNLFDFATGFVTGWIISTLCIVYIIIHSGDPTDLIEKN